MTKLVNEVVEKDIMEAFDLINPESLTSFVEGIKFAASYFPRELLVADKGIEFISPKDCSWLLEEILYLQKHGYLGG